MFLKKLYNTTLLRKYRNIKNRIINTYSIPIWKIARSRRFSIRAIHISNELNRNTEKADLGMEIGSYSLLLERKSS